MSRSRTKSDSARRTRPQTVHASAGTGKIRLLIADDHVTVLKGLAAIIGRQPDMIVVAQAADGREALDLWREHRPAITVLDSPPWVSSVVEAITVASRRGLVQV